MGSNRPAGSRSVTSSTCHWALWPCAPWLLHTWDTKQLYNLIYILICAFVLISMNTHRSKMKIANSSPGFSYSSATFYISKCASKHQQPSNFTTKAGLNAAGINPNSVSFAGTTAKCWRRIGSWTIPPSHTNVTCSTAGAPLGPAAPATVHWEIQGKNKNKEKRRKRKIKRKNKMGKKRKVS